MTEELMMWLETPVVTIDRYWLIFGAMMLAIVVLWVLEDISYEKAYKEAERMSWLRQGWENHEEWVSRQIQDYQLLSGDSTGVLIRKEELDDGTVLYTIPLVTRKEVEG